MSTSQMAGKRGNSQKASANLLSKGMLWRHLHRPVHKGGHDAVRLSDELGVCRGRALVSQGTDRKADQTGIWDVTNYCYLS